MITCKILIFCKHKLYDSDLQCNSLPSVNSMYSVDFQVVANVAILCLLGKILNSARSAVLILVISNKGGWWGMWSSRASLAPVAMKWCGSRSLGQQVHTSCSLPWTLDSSRICLVEYHGLKPWMKEGPKKAGPRLTSSNLWSNASQQWGDHVKPPEGLHGLTRSS